MPREQAISKGGPISYLDTACYFEVVVIIQHYSSWLRYSLGQSLRSLSLSRHDRHTSWIPADTLKSSNCLRAAVYKVITILTVVIWWHTRLGRTRLKRTKNRTLIPKLFVKKNRRQVLSDQATHACRTIWLLLTIIIRHYMTSSDAYDR
jgi:hypothetical protein